MSGVLNVLSDRFEATILAIHAGIDSRKNGYQEINPDGIILLIIECLKFLYQEYDRFRLSSRGF